MPQSFFDLGFIIKTILIMRFALEVILSSIKSGMSENSM